MKQISLSGSPRENVGRREAADLRNSGRIPGVIYGGAKQTPFSVSVNDWDKIVRQSDTLQINIEVGGHVYPTLIQEQQQHPVSDKVTHIDLLELIPGKPVKTSLPVRVFGSSEGVKAGGKLVQNYRKVRIFGKPELLPEDIKIDISPLNIGDLVRVRELKVEGCTILEAEASAVVQVAATRASAAEADAAKAAADPKAAKK
jgi:large subunit ribosomal protein L25